MKSTKLQMISRFETQIDAKIRIIIFYDWQAINVKIFLQEEIFYINTINRNGSLISRNICETVGMFGESWLS